MLLPIPLLAFWQFASAWMLLWGLAALVPLVIHLWNRRRYRETNWAAMEFLLAALRKNSRRIVVEQWLLLALRMGVLVCFALALAQPLLTWLGGVLGTGSGGQTFTVLVLDASYSMDYRAAEQSRFDIARDLARKIVSQGAQGEGYALVLLAEPARAIIGQPVFDSGDVLEELSTLKISHGGGDLTGTLAVVEEILDRARQDYPRLTRRRVVFFTDLGRTSWDEVQAPTCRERVARLTESASLALVDLGDQPATGNLALTRLESARPLVTLSRPADFQAEVQNFGNEPATRALLELLVDGERIREEFVEVPPGGRTSVSFTHPFEAAGEHLVQARIRDPRLLVDNVRWASVPVREALRVLCLEGRPREARHLALALEPEKTDKPRILVTDAADNTLLDRDLSEFDAVCLCNVPRFSTAESQVLSRFVEQGGGLLIFLGDLVQSERYNADLNLLLPARLGEIQTESQYRLDPREYRHPILAAFRGHERSGLTTTPVWRYLRLAPTESSQTVMAFGGGDPALVAGKFGRGRTLIFASAVSPLSVDRSVNPPLPWTAIDAWPSFPPLAQEMLEYAVGGRTRARNVLVGEELTGAVRGLAGDSTITITLPSGRTEQAPLVWQGEEAGWSFGGDLSSGPYEVQLGPPLARKELFAVNVETRESDLTRIDPEQLPSHLSREIHEDADRVAASLSPPRPWFRVFLTLVLALLAAESFVAWRMGR